MILTSLGYEGESHPMSFTTGQTTDVEKIEIYETTNANQLEVGKSYQLAANYIPSISKGEMENNGITLTKYNTMVLDSHHLLLLY